MWPCTGAPRIENVTWLSPTLYFISLDIYFDFLPCDLCFEGEGERDKFGLKLKTHSTLCHAVWGGHRRSGLIFLLMLPQPHRGPCIHLRYSKALTQCSQSLTILLMCLFHKVVSHSMKPQWPRAAFLRKSIILTEDGSGFRGTTAPKCCGAMQVPLYPPKCACDTAVCEGKDRKCQVCSHWPGATETGNARLAHTDLEPQLLPAEAAMASAELGSSGKLCLAPGAPQSCRPGLLWNKETCH